MSSAAARQQFECISCSNTNLSSHVSRVELWAWLQAECISDSSQRQQEDRDHREMQGKCGHLNVLGTETRDPTIEENKYFYCFALNFQTYLRLVSFKWIQLNWGLKRQSSSNFSSLEVERHKLLQGKLQKTFSVKRSSPVKHAWYLTFHSFRVCCVETSFFWYILFSKEPQIIYVSVYCQLHLNAIQLPVCAGLSPPFLSYM